MRARPAPRKQQGLLGPGQCQAICSCFSLSQMEVNVFGFSNVVDNADQIFAFLEKEE